MKFIHCIFTSITVSLFLPGDATPMNSKDTPDLGDCGGDALELCGPNANCFSKYQGKAYACVCKYGGVHPSCPDEPYDNQSSQKFLISTKNKTFLINVNDENEVENTSIKKEKLDKSDGTQVTLQRGSRPGEGNVFINGQPVCDDAWDDTDAGVVCRQLGYSSGSSTTQSTYGSVPTNFIMDDVNCDGSETNILDCSHRAEHDCRGSEGAGVICEGEGSCTPKPNSWRGEESCSDNVWACTDSRYPWYKELCSTTCKYCDTVDPVPSECGVENVPTTNSRIQGGIFAAPNQYPWMVRLPVGCGGSLISDRHVLTAFHCIKYIALSGNDWTGEYLKVGVHDQYDPDDFQWAPIKTAVWPKFTDGDYPEPGELGDHDIAIVILKEPVTFGKKIQPVCLPANKDLVYDGETCLAMGWGRHTLGDRSQSRYLRKVPLEVEGTMRNKNYFTTFIRRNAANSVMEVCGGDSGGPLVHQDPATSRWTVIGTVFGGHYNCTSGTGEWGESIWNKVTAHLDWINEVLATSS